MIPVMIELFLTIFIKRKEAVPLWKACEFVTFVWKMLEV